MSAIYKLSIQGIRSFDSNDRETIEFGKPLTLIVGTNGSGKTTIIECLKYATTGDLPPNSKNGAFIHDPKITGEKDIRAQVKLAFVNAKGVNMIVTRNIQLLAKKNANTFKTLEGQLVAINRGERTTLSTRATELDQQIPLYLGVPKAILDYVIFCHQEDSLWPLSEPSILKKRFDEIFQAMKFTKALDNLKTIKKDMAIDIKLLKQSVEHLKTDRDRSKATKMNVSQLENKVEEYLLEVKDIEKKLEAITSQSDELFSSNQQFQEVISRSESLQRSKSSLSEQIQRLQSSIEIIPKSKSDLQNMLSNFEGILKDIDSKLKGHFEERERIVSFLEKERTSQQRVIRLQGELCSKKEQYEHSKMKKEELLTELSNTYNIPKQNVTSEVSTMLKMANERLNTVQCKNQKEEADVEEQLLTSRNLLAKKEQQLSYISSDMKKLQNQISKLSNRSKDLNVNETELHVQKENLKSYEAKLRNWDSENVIESLMNEIKSKNQDILSLEDQLEAIQLRINKVNQHSDLFAKHSLLKGNLSAKLKDIKKMEEEIMHEARNLNVSLRIDDDLPESFKLVYNDMKEELSKCKMECDTATKFSIQSENQMKNLENQIQVLNSTTSNLELKIKAVLPEDINIEDYDEELKDSEESYKIALENLKMHRTTLEFNLKALEVAEKENCCYLCQRHFENKESSSRLIKNLQDRTDKNLQKALETTAEEVKIYLDDLKSCYDDVISYRNSIKEKNSLEKKYIEVKKDHDEKSNIQRKCVLELQELQHKFSTISDKIQPCINKLVNFNEEKSRISLELNRVGEELSIYTSQEVLESIEELQQKQKYINDRLRTLRKDISDTQSQKEDKSREYNNLLTLIREKNSDINRMETLLQERNGVIKELEANQNIIKSSEKESSILTEEVQNLKKEIKSHTEVLDEMKKRNRNVELEARDKRDKIQNQITLVTDISKTIKDFEENDSKRLTQCTELLEQHRNAILIKEKDLKDVETLINVDNQRLKDSDKEFKNIKLNIDLCDLKTQLESFDRELSSLDVATAEKEREKYQEESLRLRSAYEKLSAENAGKLGEIKQLQNQIKTLTTQINTDYKNVDELYQREWIKLQTKSLVTDDIDTYSRALDSAIMRYHSLKMKDINRIIDELWKRTYSGTDVDTIKIKTDEVSNVRGKTFNYRVVMYKQDAELDMRGRCSAGQKVLAAIIIRLALSETFGVNCGVIALDEPTTNLDEENIESLARSLGNIIEVRRHQTNFQLIVITHDEKFLNYMNASSYTDHFYKVKRDDRQKSLIEWVDINKVSS